MITYLILLLFSSLPSFIFGLIPSIIPTSFTADAFQTLNSIIGMVVPWGNWIPLDTIGVMAYYIFIAFTLTLFIRFVRYVVSQFTGGGGNVN